MLQLFSKKTKTKKPHTTPEERAEILLSLQNGRTTRQVAKSKNISPSTVSRISKKWREQRSLKDAAKPGRPPTINEPIKKKIINLITSRRCSSAPEVQKRIEEKENISISPPTIRRILRENGLVSRIKKKKPYLSRIHQKRRLEFAKEHKDWTIEDWSKIIWSDESKFKIFGSDGKQYYWKRPEEPLNRFHIKPTVKFGGGSVMIWGCFTFQGVGGFCKIDGTMDAELYQQILHEDLMGTIRNHGLDVKKIIFQQDGDPKHTANSTKRWLRNKRIKVLDWPPQSPDLNPIEHLWNEVDRCLRHLPGQISGKEDL
jgi:transposase